MAQPSHALERIPGDHIWEEIAHRDKPPLLEEVNIVGPFRTHTGKTSSIEERELIEEDARWFRYSKFAAPWLISVLLILICLLAATIGQSGYLSMR
eukprot:399578_1